MKQIVCISVFLVLATITTFSQNKEEIKKDKKEEKKGIKEFITANDKKLSLFYKKAIVDSVVDIYSPNCFVIREFLPRIDGREELKKKIMSDFKSGMKIVEYTFVVDDQKIYEDTVYEIGILTISYIDSKTKATITTKYNSTLLWKESSDKKYRIRTETRTPIKTPVK